MLAGQQRQFLAASHELHRVGRKRVRFWHHAGSPAGDGKLGVTAQNPLVEVGQRRTRFGSLLLGQEAAGFPVEAERIALPAAPVQGRHLVGDEGLIQRVLRQQAAQLADQVGVAAKFKFTLDALEDDRPAFFFQAVPHPRHPVATDPGERLAMPERVRLAEQARRMLVVPALGQGARLPAQPAELMQVNRFGIDVKHVSVGAPR